MSTGAQERRGPDQSEGILIRDGVEAYIILIYTPSVVRTWGDNR